MLLLFSTVTVAADEYISCDLQTEHIEKISFSDAINDSKVYYVSDENTIQHFFYLITAFKGEHQERNVIGSPDTKGYCAYIVYDNAATRSIHVASVEDYAYISFSDSECYKISKNDFYTFYEFYTELKAGRLEFKSISFKLSLLSKLDIDIAVENGVLPKWQCVDYEYDVNRIDICQLIAYYLNYIGYPEKESISPERTYAAKYFLDTVNLQSVRYLRMLDIVDGRTDNWFYPYDSITREEFAKILCNTYHCLYKNVSVDTSEKHFVDEDDISDWATNHVKEMVLLKILEENNGGYFLPKDNISKEEVIASLLRLNVLREQ